MKCNYYVLIIKHCTGMGRVSEKHRNKTSYNNGTISGSTATATMTVTTDSKVTATPTVTNVTAIMSTAITGAMNATGGKNKSIMPLTAYVCFCAAVRKCLIRS